jgi:hypothetical protein
MATNIVGTGSITGNCLLNSFLAASIGGEGAVVPSNLQTTISLMADLSGSGDVTGAMNMLIFLAAEVQGAGTISSAALETLAQLSSTLSGSGTITSAHLSALALLVSEIVGSGVATGAMRNDCFMSADITSAGELVTAQSCAQAVWSAVAAAFNETGTMGNKMNTASSGGVDINALVDAILLALNSTTIPVNTKKINDVNVAGTGTSGDPWGPE